MLFSEKLKMLRKEKKLTQEELAEQLNVSRQAITKWESNEGIPDIENLKQISILFNTTIDALVKDDKEVTIESLNTFIKELEIDHSKHFDIKVNKSNEISIISNNEEKVKVEIKSMNENLEELFNIKFDNLYNRLDIDVKSKNINDSIINIYIPEKYINDIELNSKIKTLNIKDIFIDELEVDGSLKYLNVEKSKGKIILNTSKCDIEANYDLFDGVLEVNTINSTSRVTLPSNTKYKTVLKGIKNKFVDAKECDDSTNIIELNGINSKLMIIEK